MKATLRAISDESRTLIFEIDRKIVARLYDDVCQSFERRDVTDEEICMQALVEDDQFWNTPASFATVQARVGSSIELSL